jgi:hypothetical protein
MRSPPAIAAIGTVGETTAVGSTSSPLNRLRFNRLRLAAAHVFDRCDEPIASTRHGLDKAVWNLVIAHRFAQQRNRVGEIRLLDKGAGPHLFEQVLLGQQMTGASDQQRQQIEGFRWQRDWLPVSREQMLNGARTGIVRIRTRAAAWCSAPGAA